MLETVFGLKFQTWFTFVILNGALWRFILHHRSLNHHISVTIPPNVFILPQYSGNANSIMIIGMKN